MEMADINNTKTNFSLGNTQPSSSDSAIQAPVQAPLQVDDPSTLSNDEALLLDTEALNNPPPAPSLIDQPTGEYYIYADLLKNQLVSDTGGHKVVTSSAPP